MTNVAVRLTALVLTGVLALPPGLALADDPADLRRSITALRQSLAQLPEPPNLMLERDLSPLERLQRWVGVGLRKEHVGQYSDLWLQARNQQSFAALEAAIAEDLLDVGAVESARKHLGYASANLRARHLYDEAASDVWRGDLAHAQSVLLEAGKTVTSSLGLLGKVFESSKVPKVSQAGLALQGEAIVLELWLDTAFKDAPTAIANRYSAVAQQKAVEWVANGVEVDAAQAELARRGIATGYHAAQAIAHLAAKVGPSAELQALIAQELRKLPEDGQASVDQAMRELARLRGRPATEADARPRPTPTESPTPTPAPTEAARPSPTPTAQPAGLRWPVTAPGSEGQFRSCTGCRVPVATVPVGEHPHAVAVNSMTNRIYVGNLSSGGLTVIDGRNNAVITTIALPSPKDPSRMSIAVNQATNRIYVTSMIVANIDTKANPNSLYVIDGASNVILARLKGSVETTHFPAGVAVHPGTNRFYVTEVGAGTNWIEMYDGATNRFIDTVKLEVAQPHSIAINPNTNRAYAARPDPSSGTVSVIDTARNVEIATIPVRPVPDGIGLNPVTNRIYVAHRKENVVSVIDGSTNSVIGTLSHADFMRGPIDVALNPKTNRVYVAGADSPYVLVFDGASNAFIGLRLMDDWPKAIAVNAETGFAYAPTWSSSKLMVLDER